MILFCDTETTGLFEREGHLLEVALVLTDDDLNETAATSIVMKPVGIDIHLVEMDDVVRSMHTTNGLFDEVRKTTVRRHEAMEHLQNFVKTAFIGVPDVATSKCVNCGDKLEKHFLQEGPAFRCPTMQAVTTFCAKTIPAMSVTPFAGSTVAFDRRWLREHMQPLEAMASYRSIDVSSLTELAQRWAPEVYKDRPKSDEKHRALSDVRGSIALLKFYRECGLIGGMKEDHG